jgi:hypothetical protein
MVDEFFHPDAAMRKICALWRSVDQYNPNVGTVNKKFSKNLLSFFRAPLLLLSALGW